MSDETTGGELLVFDDAAIGDLVPPDGDIGQYDELGSHKHAELLLRVLQSTDAPQVIAVFGDWGAGKTSIMQILRGLLDKAEDACVTVWFNTWLHENDDSLLLSMTEELRKQIAGKPKFLAKAGAVTRDALSFLTNLLRTVKVSGGVGVPGFAKSTLTVDLSKMPRKFKDKEAGEIPLPAAVNDALSKLSLSTDQRIVVFLDDLDRCRPDRAVEILENLKLVFPHKGFAFVLGIANKDLETYLAYLHKKEFGIEDYDGRRYFEKLIQVNFPVPPLDNVQAEKFVESLPGKKGDSLLKGVAPIIRNAGRNNPRAMKRFANGLLMDHHMFSTRTSESGGDVSLEDLAVARALRENWLQEYRILLGNEKECEAVVEWLDTGKHESFRAYASLSSDSDLEAILRSDAGRTWLSRYESHGDIERWVRPEIAEKAHSKRYDAYISYRWMDRILAKAIATCLKRHDLTAMWDGRLQVGMNWRKVLEDGLRQSRAMLFLVSDEHHAPDPVVSDSQMGEANLALEMADAEPEFVLVPILLYENSEKHCPAGLRDFFWVAPSNGIDEGMLDTQLDEVLKLLAKNRLGR